MLKEKHYLSMCEGKLTVNFLPRLSPNHDGVKFVLNIFKKMLRKKTFSSSHWRYSVKEVFLKISQYSPKKKTSLSQSLLNKVYFRVRMNVSHFACRDSFKRISDSKKSKVVIQKKLKRKEKKS